MISRGGVFGFRLHTRKMPRLVSLKNQEVFTSILEHRLTRRCPFISRITGFCQFETKSEKLIIPNLEYRFREVISFYHCVLSISLKLQVE